MDERRYVPRVRVARNVKIIVAAESPLVEGTLHDLTASGARLSVARPGTLPDRFDLTFDHGRSCRPCRVVWRTVNQVGVAFENPLG